MNEVKLKASKHTMRTRDSQRRNGSDRDSVFGIILDPRNISRHQKTLLGLKRRAEVVVYFYANGPKGYTGQMYLSTQTLPYHTVLIDCSTLKDRDDTPDGFMGGRSVAGVWLIREQKWIPELTHPCLVHYDWSCYPPLLHGATTEPIFAATDENGLACEIPDDANARYHAGEAADWPGPAGFDADGGRNQNVRCPPNLPSPHRWSGILEGLRGATTVGLSYKDLQRSVVRN